MLEAWLPWKGRECWELQMAAMNRERLLSPGGMFAPCLHLDLEDAIGTARPIIGLWFVRDITRELDGLQEGDTEALNNMWKVTIKEPMWKLYISKEPIRFCWGYLKGHSLPLSIQPARVETRFFFTCRLQGNSGGEEGWSWNPTP